MSAITRVIWNGAISFGLVNIPVALHPATNESGPDFDWLDKRTMDPVGYKRINKNTGQEIEAGNIVKGYAYEQGRYVVLSDDEIKGALAKSTQTIEIESFVAAGDIPLVYFERPYYLVPLARSEKAYALLREAMRQTGRAGIARVVIHTKQHLAALVPSGPALMLILLRWASEIRPAGGLNLPAEGLEGLAERDLAMAAQLVGTMAASWEPDRFQDEFTAKIMALVEEKVREGRIESVVEPVAEQPAKAELIDITELLRRSLDRAGKGRTG